MVGQTEAHNRGGAHLSTNKIQGYFVRTFWFEIYYYNISADTIPCVNLFYNLINNINWQAGTELGQAQLKLGLEFTLIFCRFGFSPFGLIEFVWLNRFGLVYLLFYISKILLGRFSLWCWFGKFAFVPKGNKILYWVL